MEVPQLQLNEPVKKRFCCMAAKKLKEKCLRFHQSEEKCEEVIKGHQECIAFKRQYEGAQLSKPIQK